MSADDRTLHARAAAAEATTTPPLAAFDAEGLPTTIGYQVPQPNRYTGIHYLFLDLDDSDFVTVDSTPRTGGTGAGTTSARLRAAVENEARQGLGPSLAPPLSATRFRPAAERAATYAAATDNPVDLARRAVVCPDTVALSDPVNPADPVVLVAPYTVSSDLSKLTWAEVKTIDAAGKQVTIYRSASGQWHFRIGSRPATFPPPGTTEGRNTLAPNAIDGDGPVHPLPNPKPAPPPWFSVVIGTPEPDNPVHGPADGSVLTVAGTCAGRRVVNRAVSVSINGGEPQPASLAANGNWSADFVVTSSGAYVIDVVATATAASDDSGPLPSKQVSRTATVMLDLPPTHAPAKPAPVLALGPRIRKVSTTDVDVVISGSVDSNGGSGVNSVTVVVPDGGTPPLRAVLTPVDGSSTSWTWAATTVLAPGSHAFTVSAENADGIPAAPVSGTAEVVATQPFRRLSRTVVLAETLELNSYGTGVGAGDVVKVFSLLPAEEAVFKVSTFTKDEQMTKSSASIVDSSSTEASADFEDTLSDERASKADSQHSLEMGLQVELGAKFGVGSASVKGSVNDKANSSREDAVKSLSTALNKHSSKAATNRSVTIDTETTSTHSSGTSEDTTRTVRNINVGRVLNYVFRRVLTEHVCTISLTDAVLLDCTVDEMLDTDGAPLTNEGGVVIRRQATAYPLAKLDEFAETNLVAEIAVDFPRNVQRLLANVADYSGTMQSLVERFVPTVDGVPAPDESYLRIRPNLTQSITTPSAANLEVPGIVLHCESMSMPTDALAVDVMLGGGVALDAYSRGLQEVAIDERRAAVAREELAQRIITEGNSTAAALWAQVYPPAPAPTEAPS